MSQLHALRTAASLRPAPRATDVLARLKAHFALARSRRALAQLDANQLQDIGITRAEAEAEAKRIF